MKSPGESSISLIRRAKGGDAGALDELFSRHIAALRRWARGRLPRWARDGVDTQDIVQESVFRASRNLESFDPKRQGALQAYLRQAVMNRIRDEVRRSRRTPPATQVDSGVVDQQPSPLETAIGDDLQERYE